jgi:hypothetical protein
VAEFDPGPGGPLVGLCARVPDPPERSDFWFDWGPVFYRGRTDGSARVLCVASDPGPTERIAGRCLVGNAGQRVQGLLAKLGLTRTYVCVNAWAYALHPSAAQANRKRLADDAQAQWRNELFDAVSGPALQAVIAFGDMAQEAIRQWPGKAAAVPVQGVPHPSSRDAKRLLDAWRQAVVELRSVVSADADGDNAGPNYGPSFRELDYAAIPRRDLPFGAPAFLGDDSWVRGGPGGAQNSVERPAPDDGHTLVWHAPPGSP